MITLANNFFGQLIRIASLCILQFNPSLQSQFAFIKHTVDKSGKQKYKFPSSLKDAILQIEDRRFYQHKGIDIYSIMRAIVKNTISNRLEGASTIAQQLVRNIIDERKIKLKRKAKEIIFAALLDSLFSKEEILVAYFNTYRFANCIGILTFCSHENYNLDDLSISQAAEIAARFKYSTLCKKNLIKYLKRVRTIEIKTSPNIDFPENWWTAQKEDHKFLINKLRGVGEARLMPTYTKS